MKIAISLFAGSISYKIVPFPNSSTDSVFIFINIHVNLLFFLGVNHDVYSGIGG